MFRREDQEECRGSDRDRDADVRRRPAQTARSRPPGRRPAHGDDAANRPTGSDGAADRPAAAGERAGAPAARRLRASAGSRGCLACAAVPVDVAAHALRERRARGCQPSSRRGALAARSRAARSRRRGLGVHDLDVADERRARSRRSRGSSRLVADEVVDAVGGDRLRAPRRRRRRGPRRRRSGATACPRRRSSAGRRPAPCATKAGITAAGRARGP